MPADVTFFQTITLNCNIQMCFSNPGLSNIQPELCGTDAASQILSKKHVVCLTTSQIFQ